ncbi:hypothetical protein DFH08DRAFT_826570 [Mycena albidolilacea]|uniref:Uncharacterized protein n=1 Tax=Mycena albidolilacea TaxID=1033008 RepID=A0AAD6Z0K4_9AGAR|nr:hypothetical protein DFH08DRAFT_826570 [Mycena albidolilacea]
MSAYLVLALSTEASEAGFIVHKCFNSSGYTSAGTLSQLAPQEVTLEPYFRSKEKPYANLRNLCVKFCKFGLPENGLTVKLEAHRSRIQAVLVPRLLRNTGSCREGPVEPVERDGYGYPSTGQTRPVPVPAEEGSKFPTDGCQPGRSRPSTR